MTPEKDMLKLLADVEALCAAVNSGAEQWGTTCQRLVELEKLTKKIRKKLPQ